MVLINKLSEKEYWDQHWNEEKKIGNPTQYIFNDLLKEYLPYGGTYLEIGCTPGTTMVNFHKTFGYSVSGIDYSQADTVRKTLEKYNVVNGQVIDSDFTTMSVFDQFDVVASYGFLEHFENYSEIVGKQAEFVKPGGYLVIEVPNLRYFYWLMYRIFDPELLRIHNLKIMSPSALSDPIRRSSEFEILFNNYYFTNFFFLDANNPVIANRLFIRKNLFFIRKIMKVMKLDNIPNRFFSPYLIIIARKKS